MQVSAEWRILATMAPAVAASRSASANTTNGALPPSSITTLRTRSAQRFSSTRPISVEPVNDSIRTARWSTTASSHAPELAVGTKLTTPGGTPASASSSATRSEVSGASRGGLMTTALPAASAGASLRVIMAAGKFHGVIMATTPTGGWRVMMRLAPEGATLIEPWMRTASSAFQRKNSAA